jgi:hypothetical protein
MAGRHAHLYGLAAAMHEISGPEGKRTGLLNKSENLQSENLSFLLIKPQQNGMGRRLLWKNSSST